LSMLMRFALSDEAMCTIGTLDDRNLPSLGRNWDLGQESVPACDYQTVAVEKACKPGSDAWGDRTNEEVAGIRRPLPARYI
jgi:hypothetical protein